MFPLSCAVIGHRPERFLWGDNDDHTDCIKLKLFILNYVNYLVSLGIKTFYSGMERGVEQWGAMAVLGVREVIQDIKLYCIRPFEGQQDNWPINSYNQYNLILMKSGHVTRLKVNYTKTCMRESKRYLVNNSDIVFAIYDGKKCGETNYTIKYAKEKGKQVIIIDPNMVLNLDFPVLFEAMSNAAKLGNNFID